MSLLLARGRWSDRRLGVLVAALALAKGLVWIALMPVFKIADEPSHFENIQYRAEFLHKPRYNGKEMEKVMHAGAPPEVLDLWGVTTHYQRNLYLANTRSLPEEKVLQQMAGEDKNRRGDGQITSINYPGFYYNIGVVAYDLFRHSTVLARIFAVRFISCLFGVFAAVATYFAARKVMESQALAVAASVMVTLEPMEAQMTAAVNNDAAIIGLSAVIFYLQVRILVDAPAVPPLWMGALLGTLAGFDVLSKPQGYAMLPGCAFVCSLILLRNLRSRKAWYFASAAAVSLLLWVVPYLWISHLEGANIIPGGSSPKPAHTIGFYTFATTLDDNYRNYLFKSTIGQFGWLEYSLGGGWLEYTRQVASLGWYGLIAAIAVRALWPDEAHWLAMRGFLFSLFTALFAVAFVLFAEYRLRLDGISGVIQGRNFLFGLPAAAIVICACWGSLVPARFRMLTAASLVTCAVAIHFGGIFLIWRYHYGT